MSKALYIGRFQPFHNGHIDAINQIFNDENINELIIGIGSSQDNPTSQNPFSYYQRKDMIEEFLNTNFANKKIKIVPIPDFNNTQKWIDYIFQNLPEFDIIYSGNPYTELCFGGCDIEFRRLEITKIIKAVNIRRVILESKNWTNEIENLIPKNILEYLQSIEAPKILEKIYEKEIKEKNPKFKKGNSPSKILVIEKATRFEFLENKIFKGLDEKKQAEIKNSHKEHKAVRNYVFDLLEENNLDFKEIADTQIDDINFGNFDMIMTLGGDGTFLRGSKKVTDQFIMGVNTEPGRSIGFLTKHSLENLPEMIKKIKEGNFNFENWNRLSLSLNGVNLPHLALNEILISKPKIYATSKLDIETGSHQGYSIGNGILISTFMGSTAFYKSSGGAGFDKPNFGYTLVLPFYTDGNLNQTMVLNSSSKIKISPKRSGHTIVFDCDENREIKLNIGDEIVIKQDSENALKVIVPN